jgi:sortase A
MRSRGSAAGVVRRCLRFVAHVLIVSGVLLLSDAGATLAWQEPVSALQANHQQHDLERSLQHPLPRVLRRQPLRGDAIGKIEMPTLGRSYYVVEGTAADDLRRGPGHYPDTPLPGEHGTTAIAGHRTTHGAPFRTIDKLKHGDRIVLSMPYGRYTYRVYKTLIVAPTDVGITKRVGFDQLVMSACHPLYSAAQRLVVFSKLTKREPARVRGGRKVS